MPRGRPKGAKNRKTSARERAEKIAIARTELAKHAPPIDFTATLDSLDVLEKVMRRFYFRGLKRWVSRPIGRPPTRLSSRRRRCRALCRARVADELQRRRGTRIAEHLKLVLSIIDRQGP